MIKIEELRNPNSCINKALPGEMVFVCLARDLASPDTIRHWMAKRISLGLNNPNDDQIVEADNCSMEMEIQRRGWLLPAIKEARR